MELKIDDANMQKLIGEALVQSLDQKGRDALIGQALTFLVTKTKQGSGYGAKEESPIDLAFRRAIQNEAEKFARELVATPEFSEKMQSVLRDAMAQVFVDGKREALVQNMAEAMRKILDTQPEY